VYPYWISRHCIISTGHETINLALICPYSTLWTHIEFPGITKSALDVIHLIWPLLALIQLCVPVFNVPASHNQHWTWDNQFCLYSPLFNLVDPYLMSSHWMISTGHETINFALICPYSTLWSLDPYLCIWCPGIDWLALDICPYANLFTCIQCPDNTQSGLDMRHLIWPLFALVQLCVPVFDVQALTDQHWTWDN
jgi:hypothetical protein